MNIQLKTIQLYYRIISVIAPRFAFKQAIDLFQTVRKKNIRKREQEFYNKARQYKLNHSTENLFVYELGENDAPPILLLHGWDSNAGSMSMIADRMVDKGYKVITINLPAHAFSNLKKTNFFECKNAFIELIKHVNPIQPISVITHSFGSGVAAAAFSELDYPIDKMVLLTSSNKLIDFFVDFKKLIKLGDKSYQLMCNWASNLLKEDLESLEITDKIKLLNFKHLLLIHDKNDKIIPFHNSKYIHSNIRNSTLIDHLKTGHYRMLWNKDVLENIDNFIPACNN